MGIASAEDRDVAVNVKKIARKTKFLIGQHGESAIQ